MKKEKELEHADLTRSVLACCFEVAKQLGCRVLVNFIRPSLEYRRLLHVGSFFILFPHF